MSDEHKDIAQHGEHEDEHAQEDEEEEQPGWQRPKDLPADLPRSLDDRRRDPTFDYGGETEYYDGWQGMLPS